MSDSRPAPTSALPHRRSEPTLSDLSPNYPEPKALQEMLPKETYLIEGFLGRGGMGAVYHGIQISLNRQVAVKIMELGIGEQFDYSDRFRREAQAMAAMSHPGIVAVHDFGVAGGRYLYIVMEFIDGSDLQRVIKAGQMTPQIALHLMPQICDAVAYAHEHGIIHRDIKPANILLTHDWRTKVTDFGLAKRATPGEYSLATRTNVSMGTPDYAAPEQFKTPASVDHRADIYALGVTFYQMLTGELPRGAWQPPSVLVKTDPRLDPILIKALMPRPEERYQNARELQQSILAFTQALAWEYQQRAQAGPAAQPAVAVATAQVPKPQKPVGKISAPGSHPPQPAGQAKATPAPRSGTVKSRTPLLIGLGAAAALAIGAFALLGGGGREKVGQASGLPAALGATGTVAPPSAASTPDGQTLTSSATASTPPPSPATKSLTLALQARMEAVPWVRMDLAGPLQHASNPNTPPPEFRNGRLHLKDGYYLQITPEVRDVAVRVKFAEGSAKANSIQLRHMTGGRKTIAGRQPNGSGTFAVYDVEVNQTTHRLSDKPPLPPPGTGFALESFAIGDTFGMAVDGQWLAIATHDSVSPSGKAVVYGEDALIESIEYKILDGAPAPVAAAAGRAAGPPAAPPPEWQKLDFSAPLKSPYNTNPGSHSIKGGLLELLDNHAVLIVDKGRDMAVRVRLAANADEADVKLNLRGITPGKRFVAGRNGSKSSGQCYILDSKANSRSSLAPEHSLPERGTAWTLEAFALGESTGAFVDGRPVAYAETSEVSHTGTAHLNARHALIESIEYLVLDDIPREQWPAHLREAIESKGQPAPLAQSAMDLDPAGWRAFDLASVTEEPGKVERLPDGAVQIISGSIRTETHALGDAAIRVRFRGTSDNSDLRIILRDADNLSYSVYLHRDGSGFLRPFTRGTASLANTFNETFKHPGITRTSTLELRAQGSTLTALLDGKQVARVEDDQLKSGRLGIYAARAIVESFEYWLPPETAPASPGELVWKTWIGANISTAMAEGPDGTLYAATENGRLIALDPADGSVRWEAALRGDVFAPAGPVIADDGTVLATSKGALQAFDPADGKEKWAFPFEQGQYNPPAPAVTADGKVFFAYLGAHCLDLNTGRELWPAPVALPNSARVSPIISRSGQLVLFKGAFGLVVDPLTGNVLTEIRANSSNLPSCMALALDGGILYASHGQETSTGNGRISAHRLPGPELLWEQKINGAWLASGMALDGSGRLFAWGEKAAVTALDAATGTVLWSRHDDAAPRGFALGSDGLLYTTLSNDLACLNSDDGSVLWRHAIGKMGAPLLTRAGLLIVGAVDHNIHAIQTASPGILDSPWPMNGQNPARASRAPAAQILTARDTPTDLKLREIEAAARAEYDAGPGKVFADATATLRAQYINALKARAAQSQREGHLDEVLALQKEAEAFENGLITPPPADFDGTPAPLKQLRATFRQTLTGHEAARDQAAQPIHTKWDAALDTLQKDLTKAGEINEALRVKKLRDQIQATKALTIPVAGGIDPGGSATGTPKPGSLPPAATGTTGSQTRTTTPAPKTVKVDERQLAVRILSAPGSNVQVFLPGAKSSTKAITTAADLPAGKWNLGFIMVPNASSLTETDLLEIASCPRLSSLRIISQGYKCLTPAVLAALGNASELDTLNLGGHNLEDADFAPLVRCKKLTSFIVQQAPKFTGKGLRFLTGLPLVSLELRSCPMGDEALAPLESLPRLESLYLESLPITAAVLDRLPTSLKTLSLTKLSALYGQMAALRRLTKLEDLSLNYWGGLDEEESAALASLPLLRDLKVTGLDEAMLPKLAGCASLEILSLDFKSAPPPATLAGISAFSQHRKLRTLALGRVSDEATRHLAASLPELRSLKFEGQFRHLLTDAALEPLKTLKKLETLDLTGTKVTPAALADLKKALPKCIVTGP